MFSNFIFLKVESDDLWYWWHFHLESGLKVYKP